MEFAPVRAAVYNWFRNQSGVTVIWADQASPRPPRPYATLKIISGTVKLGGQDNLRMDPVTGAFLLNGPRKITVSCNVFGEEAVDILTGVRDSLDDPGVIDDLDAHGLSVSEDGNVQDMTEALETHFESRAQMDVIFMLQVERLSSAQPIEKIGINGKPIVIKI